MTTSPKLNQRNRDGQHPFELRTAVNRSGDGRNAARALHQNKDAKAEMGSNFPPAKFAKSLRDLLILRQERRFPVKDPILRRTFHGPPSCAARSFVWFVRLLDSVLCANFWGLAESAVTIA